MTRKDQGSTVFATLAELEAGLEEIRSSPRDSGKLELIVRRPAPGEREVLESARLDERAGLPGDRWCSKRAQGAAPDPRTQLTLMNTRVISLLARNHDRWSLSGDQLFLDIDLSEENLPPGSHLSIGEAMIQITDAPHTGCARFTERFGSDAVRFIHSTEGMRLRLRGVHARVARGGLVRVGDPVRKL